MSPAEIAVAAYDATLNEQLGNPPGHVLGPSLLDNPAIVAMLAAHEKALREQIEAEIRAFAKEAAKTDSVDAVLGLITGAIMVSGRRKNTIDELADDLDDVLGEVKA